ncbi:PREDICTED: UDP-glucose 6-dehydrogenase 4-like [Fragaria vesca subsp. vesca]|uniref:UDP-glucose 6-dehydrogenase 4-like n=1 Tax=Fragaria vesca subsp. vesca TaxID=101020 RepID=UPI0002C35C4C|nr:PREDICTED: UDP-glucose 6-dehydrogenase 4-like [Fragaria vesca subsp. vesca]
MAVIAERYPRLNVVVTDFNAHQLHAWRQNQIEYEEEGMAELLHYITHANLSFNNDVNEAIQDAQMIFIGVEIPIKLFGRRDGFSLWPWIKAIRRIIKEAHTSKIIVERSTMPIDSFDMTTTLLTRRVPPPVQPAVQFVVLSNPDFSSPGARLQDLRNPDRVVIGLKSNAGGVLPLRQLYMGLVQNPEEIRIVYAPSAVNVEIAKLATNAMLSMKLTYINAISSLCNKTRGADINIVRQILGEDYRLDNNYMIPTLGIGGKELMKDTLYMKHAFSDVGLDDEAMLFQKVVQLDVKKRMEFVQIMLRTMLDLTNRRIAIIGLTYKGQVLDLTRSPAVSICKALLRERAFLQIHEPLLDEQRIQRAIGNPNSVYVAHDLIDACDRAHAAVFFVPMPQVQFNFQQIFNVMTPEPGGRYLFMGWHMNVNFDDLRQMGFLVNVIGKP